MASKRTENTALAFTAALAAAVAIGYAVDPPKPAPTTGDDPAFEQRYQKAQAEKREQERALFCAGRPEQC